MKNKYIICLVFAIIISFLSVYFFFVYKNNNVVNQSVLKEIINNTNTLNVSFKVVDIKVTSDLNSNGYSYWKFYADRVGYVTGTIVGIDQVSGVIVMYLDDSYKMVRYPFYNTIRLYIVSDMAKRALDRVLSQQVITAQVKILPVNFQNNKEYVDGILIDILPNAMKDEYDRVIAPFQRLRGTELKND